MNQKVSKLDQEIYIKIRENVNNFLKTQSIIYDSNSIKILDIAPQIHLGTKEFFIKSNIYTADIDQNSGADFIIDICKNNKDIIESDYFDLVVCTEVLEHTLNPFSAISEIHRILKPEGILLMSTPFNFRIHGPLPDCWRFTEHGIKSLLNDFEIININGLEDENRFLMQFHYTTIAQNK